MVLPPTRTVFLPALRTVRRRQRCRYTAGQSSLGNVFIYNQAGVAALQHSGIRTVSDRAHDVGDGLQRFDLGYRRGSKSLHYATSDRKRCG